MYIDDFEDFYRTDENEFAEEFDSRDNFDEEDDLEEFQGFTEFEYLDDFRGDNTSKDFDDTEKISQPNHNSFMCPAVCPFYRQFYRQFPPGPPGPGGPGGPGQGNRPPSGPPPSVAPQQPLTASGGPQLYAVDPGSIRRCRFRYVYIWPRRGRGFWMWLTFVGRRSIAGWRWNGFTWYYFGMDLRRIESFRCY